MPEPTINGVTFETMLHAEYRFPRPGGIEVALAEVEQAMIQRALDAEGGVKRRAAIRLGISRYALERRLVRIQGTMQAQATAAELAARRAAGA